MVVPNRTLRPHIIIQAARYQIKNWRIATEPSHLTLAEAHLFRKAQEWCLARNNNVARKPKG